MNQVAALLDPIDAGPSHCGDWIAVDEENGVLGVDDMSGGGQ